MTLVVAMATIKKYLNGEEVPYSDFRDALAFIADQYDQQVKQGEELRELAIERARKSVIE